MPARCGSATVDTCDAMGYRALDNFDAYVPEQAPRDRLV
jgi:hypothetical protein